MNASPLCLAAFSLIAMTSLSVEAAGQPASPPKLPDKEGLFAPAAPFVYDPVTQDLGDPTILFNKTSGKAWVFYSQRPHFKTDGPGWYHGGHVGILSSSYAGFSWMYRGTAQGLDDSYEPGRNGFWAPEVIYHDKKYHMYVTFVRGVPLYGGPLTATYYKDPEDLKANGMLYYTSTDMLRWTFVRRLNLEPDNGSVIDAGIHPLRDGKWRMWYRGRTGMPGGGGRFVVGYADSADLLNWEHKGFAGFAPEVTGYAEAPHVFHWKGWFWLLLDGMGKQFGEGLILWRSKDAMTWENPRAILPDKGSRPKDNKSGHGSVVLQGERAFLLYNAFSEGKQCTGQLAELLFSEDMITATRDIRPMKLDATKAPIFRGGNAPNFEN